MAREIKKPERLKPKRYYPWRVAWFRLDSYTILRMEQFRTEQEAKDFVTALNADPEVDHYEPPDIIHDV